MPPRNRPTAFEVSFGEPGPSTQASRAVAGNSSSLARPAVDFVQGSSQRPLVATASQETRNPEKRKTAARDGAGERPDKRARSSLLPKQYCDPDDDDYVVETADMIVFGEDPDEEPQDDESRKPIRVLTDFVIFDTKNKNELVPLDALYDRTIERHLEAVGNVAPMFTNEEDAGLDDDVQEDTEMQRLRTTVIWQLDINYISDDSVYIGTQYAWYALRRPRNSYRAAWMSFYRPHRLAQLIMTFVNEDCLKCSHETVIERFADTLVDELAGLITPKDIKEAESIIPAILDDYPDEPRYHELRSSVYVQWLRRQSSQHPIISRPRSPAVTHQQLRKRVFSTRNIDLFVLQPENQSNTTVTPLIYKIAEGLFSEKLTLLAGSFPRPTNAHMEEQRKREELLSLLRKANKAKAQADFPSRQRIHGKYWGGMIRDGVEYKIGDVVLIPAGEYPGRKREPIPEVIDKKTVPIDRTVADYFWFGRIVFFDQQTGSVHLRWFEHSSKTLMQEIHDPHELFVTDICNTIEIASIVEKIPVIHFRKTLLERNDTRFDKGGPHMRFHDTGYFYSFKYNQRDGSFRTVSDNDQDLIPGVPPDTCAMCRKQEAQEHEDTPQSIANAQGIALRGTNYHINDFVMLRRRPKDDLTCMVAQIVGFMFDDRARAQGECTLTVEPLGRISDILEHYTGKEVILKDERQFFLTSEMATIEVPASDLIRKCRVVNYSSLPTDDLQAYLDESPYHFYVKYIFPRLKVTKRDREKKLKGTSKRPEICCICWREYDARSKNFKKYTEEREPLRAFDPFGGVGAFGLSMQEAGCIRLTHAVEISPSAALTIKKNSPQTQVFNQCSNLVLQDAVKRAHVPGYETALSPKHPSVEPFPEQPLKRGDIDCIIAGFPCQPHSQLNMYQKASDRKSHLILNLLSWVDFLEPKFCYFENVRGFLQYNLNTIQKNRYRVKGGIPMGGLKFLVRAIVTMGYQVRFGVLQAAHYGVPQSRTRFFLIAARMDQPLPKFPVPLYGFPLKDGLEVKFPHGLTITPINTQQGVVPFRYITVDDAIGDLYRFDWRTPRKYAQQRIRIDPITNKEIPIVGCDKTRKICFPFKSTTVLYHTDPRTRFQKKAREKQHAVKDLQHITRVLREATIERVCHIPLQPKADYHALYADRKNLPDDLFEWGWSDPKSAVARRGFRKGLYGRLDANGWFNTTVTNVEPTAKQSWVLNPYRVVTVRELARSQGFPDNFQFYCVDSPNVKTMQREIGNAVPWQVGYALGRELRDTLFDVWLEQRR